MLDVGLLGVCILKSQPDSGQLYWGFDLRKHFESDTRMITIIHPSPNYHKTQLF